MTVKTILATLAVSAFCVSQSAMAETYKDQHFIIELGDGKGNYHNCAGRYAYLFETTETNRGAMETFFASDEKGFSNVYKHRNIFGAKKLKFTEEQAWNGDILDRTQVKPKYITQCSEDGVASFDNVDPGDYFYVTPIFWKKDPKSKAMKQVQYRGQNMHRDEYFTLVPKGMKGGVYMVRVDTRKSRTTIGRFNVK